ncbi:MAG TPA: hypothetical protein VNO30_24840 [Kofleriaceae bacterium]|nr:hypothetical protein [Kofleriaceae bacterium]
MTRKPAPPPLGDGWFQSEEPTRLGLVFELRRMALRFRVRPIPALLIALVITTGIGVKVARKPKLYSADVVLALTEGAQFPGKSGIPFDQLRGYVTSSLMPEAKLLKLVEDRNLYRLRKTLGPQWAVDQLRGQLDVEIWKNSFVYYDLEDYRARKDARIGLTVTDSDPDRAITLVRDIASIVMETHEQQRQMVAAALSNKVAMMREELDKKLSSLTAIQSVKQAALAAATREGDARLAATLFTEVAALAHDQQIAEDQLSVILKSPEAMADQLTAAGLGMRIDMVEERRPERPEQSWLPLALTLIVVGSGSLVGAMLFLGAFDPRVHDTDDVARLGFPVLGHVPGFPGDRVGSLRSRGARRARVPWYLRWRSRR